MIADTETMSPSLAGMVAACEEQWGGPLYLTQQAATLIGVHKLTIIRWRKAKLLSPTHTYHRGAQTFPLYTAEDIEVGKIIKDTNRPGPVPGSHHRAVHVATTKEARRARTNP